ncbi:MAG: DeoR family transcriptional regulator [Patescibacteria group bacterium]|jgi:hypothetical protein
MPTENTNEPIVETPTPPVEPAAEPAIPIVAPVLTPEAQPPAAETPPPPAEPVNATNTSPPADAEAMAGEQPSPYQGEGAKQTGQPSGEGAKQTGITALLMKAKEKIQFRKRAKLEKIMALAQSRGKITNNDAQKLLRVSDATATRYLAELVKQGRLRRVGPANNAFYEING